MAFKVWPNDGLPHQICIKCVAKLHIVFQFKKLCEKSDRQLRVCQANQLKINTMEHDIGSNGIDAEKNCQQPSVEEQNNYVYVECKPNKSINLPTSKEFILENNVTNDSFSSIQIE